MKKVAIIGSVFIGVQFAEKAIITCVKSQVEVIQKELEREEIAMRISAVPKFDFYKQIKKETMRLPQKDKHRKKRPFHN